LIILLILVAIGVVTYFNRTKQVSEVGLVKEVKRTRSPVTVEVARAEDLAETISHTDAVAAARDVYLTAEVAGKVTKLHKDLGDRCRKGEALLQLDNVPYRIAVSQAEASFKQARVQLIQARRDLARAKKLVARSTVAAKTAEVAETGVQTAEAGAKQAGAALLLAKRNLRLSRVTCPFSGHVAERMVNLGQMVSNATPLARLVDRSRLKLTINVPAADLAQVKVGQRVDLADPSIPGSSFSGKVSRMGVAADKLTHSFPVEVAVDTGEGVDAPRPGQVLRATITIATHPGALAVPADAVLRSGAGGGAQLVLARGNKAQLVSVTPGPSVGERVIIKAGLTAGAQVITVGHHGLKDGAAIEVVSGGAAEASTSTSTSTATLKDKGK